MRALRLSAFRAYLLLEGGSTGFFFLINTVAAVYGVELAHLNALQLVLVGTTLEATALLCQMPTGALADALSRRLSILIGLVLSALGFVLWGAVARFETILLAQVIWGLGYTFYDGAQRAWIADELGDAAVGRAFIRGAQAGQIGAVGGIIAGAAMATVNLRLPIILGGVLFLALAGVLWLCMPERPRVHSAVRPGETLGRMAAIVRDGLRAARDRQIVLAILGIAAIFGAASEGIDRLRDIHFLKDIALPHLWGLKPVVWFGVIQMGGLGLSAVAAEVAQRLLDTTNHRHMATTLALMNILIVATIVLFGLATGFGLALVLVWIVYVLRRTNTPLMAAWLNQSLEPATRATLFSLQSLVDSLGQVLIGPLLGVLATVISIRAGIVISGLLFAPALVVYAWTLRTSTALQEERKL